MDRDLYETFAAIEDYHWWFAGRRDVIRAIFQTRLSTTAGETRSILDVGCGTGGMLPLLQEFGKVEGIDSAPEAVRHCRQRFGDQIPVSLGRLPEAIVEGEKKDVITAFDVIEHIDDDAEVLATIAARLTSDGLLVCTVPAYEWLWSQHDEVNRHMRRYTKALLTDRLTSAGFDVSFISYFNMFLLPAVAAVRMAQRVVKAPAGRRSDFDRSPAVLNAVLRRFLTVEAALLCRRSLPFGVSLVAVGRKRRIET